MIKYGLKLWSDNERYVTQAEKLYEKNVYDYIELYIVPDTYDKYIKIWRNLDAPYIIHCTHYMHGFNLADKERFKDNLKMFSEVKAFCDKLNGRHIIVHPGIEGTLETTIDQINHIKDKRLLVENKPYISMRDEHCRGSLFEELERIINSCKVGFCLDIPHAINAAVHLKEDCYKYLEKMLMLSPKVIHISDGNMKTIHDNHLNIGEGDFDFKAIGRIISNSDVPYLTLETCKNSDELRDFVEDMRKVKDIIN